ncbi:beta-1,3-galactosyltransferase 1-like [Haliotis rubra]|uniref:beta-1,3-galactosyltransferase 1-like n=1 Tax=Haliotis rubra TaxID=36100 RepID=UPI001EE5E925|nr:beta-1,3-galactosyltransferase 1-like [Haliotis rubra]
MKILSISIQVVTLTERCCGIPSNFYDVFSTSPKCQRNTSLLTIIITSSPDHLDQRSQIRQTWCNASATGYQKGEWQCVFLIGQTSLSYIDSAVEEEADNFQDILRGTYIDSYRNLTLKVLHGLNWVSRLCPTQYTLKTDDDCFVNTLQLYDFLQHSNTIKTNLYVGNIFHKLQKRKVVRSVSSKWSVSKSDYSPDHYPPYASGTGYVLSRDVVDRVVVESQYIKAIPNEDAFIGIVVNLLRVEPTSSFRFTFFSEGLRLCNYLYVLVVHRVQPEQHHILHASMLKAPQSCQGDTGDLHSWS